MQENNNESDTNFKTRKKGLKCTEKREKTLIDKMLKQWSKWIRSVQVKAWDTRTIALI